MKLYLNEASPYARLCRVLLIETELAGQTEFVNVDPWAASDDYWVVNPSGKVPALALDDGTVLIESACIIDYLINVSGRADLSVLAQANAARRLEILGFARAAMDCAFAAVIQQRFGENSGLAERWLQALPRIARRLETLTEAAARNGRSAAGHELEAARCDVADLTLAVAFGYVQFRLPQVDWQVSAPRLAESIELLSARPSLECTRPM